MNPALFDIGSSAYQSLAAMVEALDSEEDTSDESVREAIETDALSVEVRSDWAEPGKLSNEPTEYRILLSTGGPATRITGTLEHGQPVTARLEVQDWGTPWEEYVPADEDILLCYASVFYFGE